MRLRFVSAVTLAIILGLSSPWVFAQGKGKGKEKAKEKKTAGEKIRTVLPEGEMVFTEHDRVLVKNWFQNNRSGLPPGLARREHLPPGLEKQLRERGTLPPGLQKKIQPLPPELESQMQKIPTGFRRVVIAGQVILMNRKTSRIYDVIRNVVP
jgi:hypothetical protein